MEIKMINSPSTPTSPNADSAPSTVDGRQADNDIGQRPACSHITELETTTIDDQSKGIRTFICRCGRRGESILTIEPRTEPIDFDETRTPLAAGGILDTPNLGIEIDKPEATVAASGRVVGSTHQGEKRKFWIDWDGQGDVVLWSNRAYLGADGWCNVTPVCRRGALPEVIRDEAWALITAGVEDRIAARLVMS